MRVRNWYSQKQLADSKEARIGWDAGLSAFGQGRTRMQISTCGLYGFPTSTMPVVTAMGDAFVLTPDGSVLENTREVADSDVYACRVTE